MAGGVSRCEEQAHGAVADQVVVPVDEDDLILYPRVVARVEEIARDRR